ncbi:MAG: hypothetical protein DI626_02205, partial [Micavibrio aeruginosavorus]
MIMPVFIALGLSARNLNLTKTFFVFSVFVLIVALVEAMYIDAYLSLLNIRDYYIQKGGMIDTVIHDQNLFASGDRPDGRFLFDIRGVHRISSIFLEPVSLGFYAAITAMFFVSVKETISGKLYYATLSICLGLIILSDARMAFATFMVVIFLRFLFRCADHRFSILVLPAVLICAYFIDAFSLMEKTGEGLGYRIHVTIRLLSHLDMATALGLSDFGSLNVVDSGLGTLFENQGILGILVYWLAPLIFMKKLSLAPRIYTYGVAIYTAFGFLVSPAIFSIKTASLLWFQLGYLIGRDLEYSADKQSVQTRTTKK